MKPKIKVVGLEQMRKNVGKMIEALDREALVPIMREHMEPMADDMRSHAPRDTGALAKSITVSTQLSPAQAAANVPIAEVEVYAGPGPVPQAIQEEFGNFRQRPRPIIRPTFDANHKTARRKIGEDGIAVILDAAKKG